ncbi:gag/pol protein [Cucumis melo var. makuwa]|uniref:Gag/pol protein n=1 Tax=Cucumis melo var. makuwa TaxID=1194695 RepID=A0A5A7VJ81_CUCMM|nr:gag/pol protein [Cucumis melo var. makuwa]
MVSKTQAIKYIYTKCMKEGTSVREHVLDMMMHFDNAEVNGGAIDEANQNHFLPCDGKAESKAFSLALFWDEHQKSLS